MGAVMIHLGSTPLTACATIRAIGVLPEARRVALARHHERRSAVIGSRSVAGRHGAVFLERGTQLRERFERSVLARRFVILDHHGLALFLRNLDGHNLRFDEAGFPRAHGALVAFQRKLILLLPRDAVFFGHEFGGDAHVKIVVHVPQAVVHHRVHDFRIAEPVTGARAWQQIRAVGHRLHAARDHNFGFAQHDALRRKAHGLQSRAANFVDGHRRNAHVQAAAQARLPRGILPQPRLHHVAHDDFIHRFRLDARAAHGFGDDFRAQLRRGKRRKSALKFSDGRTDSAENDGLVHGMLSRT